MKTKGDLTFRYPQEENPDWGYARNRCFVLKRTDACWSSSLFSVKKDGFTAPNRDYPQQGLLFKTGDRYTKFMDAPMFKLLSEGNVVELEPSEVELTPWKAKYIYRNDETALEVVYYLSPSTMSDKAGGWIKFTVDSDLNDLELVVSPLVDIRGIGEESPDKGEYTVKAVKDTLRISRDGYSLMLKGDGNTIDHVEQTKWKYKLGDGFREEGDGGIRFRDKERKPLRAGAMTFELNDRKSAKIGIACGRDIHEVDAEFFRGSDPTKDRKLAERTLGKFSFPDDEKMKRFMKARILSFSTFSTRQGGIEMPEAGEWWFKDVWFRDLFESLYHEMEVYQELKGDQWIKKLLTWARIYIKDGVMASKVDKSDPAYNSIDGSLLYLLCAAKYYEKTGDKEFKENIHKTFYSVIQSLWEEDGLIRCRPEYSWMDSVIDGRSTRIPENWDVEDESKFLLPEVNALWIKVLEEYDKLYGADEDIRKAWGSFKEMFWDDKKGFLYQIVYEGSEVLRDHTESSAAVMALGMLKDYFFGYELMEAWEVIKQRLLVHRKPVYFDDGHVPFGILTKNSKRRTYMGDAEYHEAVIWPRDSTYLFMVLEKIGRKSIKEEILKNTLDHQMSEGAIFYNHELFSLPEGVNPHETSQSSNPVPVKNPIQLWSHFLTDFLEVKEG